MTKFLKFKAKYFCFMGIKRENNFYYYYNMKLKTFKFNPNVYSLLLKFFMKSINDELKKYSDQRSQLVFTCLIIFHIN